MVLQRLTFAATFYIFQNMLNSCRNMKRFFSLTAFLFLLQTAHSQNFWENTPESSVSQVGTRYIVPDKYQTKWLNVLALQQFLADVPERFTSAALETSQLPVFILPDPDGRSVRFQLTESPVMHPDLQAQYPEIRCYTGYGIDDPTAFLKCDLTPHGFHAMVTNGTQGTYFVDPYSFGDRDNYVVYYKKDYPRPAGKEFECKTGPGKPIDEPADPLDVPEQGSCQLRRYRLALACTAEYTSFQGGSVALALAAMNTSMNRVNGIYEKELAVTMQLVANNNLLVYTNSITDPYTNDDSNALTNENQVNCDAMIGTANYDIGHVFSTAGGGLACLGCVCVNGAKASAETGTDFPIGDGFDVDYVAHEMGHQFNGDHTFNGTASSCGGGNRNLPTAYEPGSGSTIMAYAGICGAQNVQTNSDAYFHASSLVETGTYIIGTGATCGTIINTSNNPPTASAGSNYTIPKSTPFTLTASGTDPNGNALTYNWEQFNNNSSTQPPLATATGGPNFRSFAATTSPSRTFPALSAIIANTTPTWEVLPSVARTMNFRVNVRDNASPYGCTEKSDMTVTVNGTAGPFQVTAPNTAVSWAGNSTQTITWNVAGTTTNSVNCANVKISLSTDGGFTYPTVLLASTANDGTENIVMPNISTTTARVKIEGVGNIFFDISNANFTITFSLPVELIDFQVNAKDAGDVLLQWTTASEKNNLGFDIEMKHESDTDFQKAGFMYGRGTTTEKSTYDFLIRNLKEGRWYFRLKQMDSDGKMEYSPVRNLEIRAPFSIQVFPNPARNVLNVVAYSDKETLLSFELANQLGQRFPLLESEQSLQRGYNNLQFDVSTFPAGIYYYTCRTGGGLLQGEVVVE